MQKLFFQHFLNNELRRIQSEVRRIQTDHWLLRASTFIATYLSANLDRDFERVYLKLSVQGITKPSCRLDPAIYESLQSC